ncbi:MAG: hypothetical protein NT175_02255 [Bacteroidetes bacterium]|nr:hypothetical protein [Bacteroidota bacterium]
MSNYFKYSIKSDESFIQLSSLRYHQQIGKVTKTKGAFASENALMKIIYLASTLIIEK